jgi:hypothetical protein
MKNDTTAILGALSMLEQIVDHNESWLQEHGASPRELLANLHESRGALIGALNAAGAALNNAEGAANAVAGVLERLPEGPFVALLRILQAGGISGQGIKDTFPPKPSSSVSGPLGLAETQPKRRPYAAKKTPPKKTPAKKSAPKKAPAKKSPAKKAPAKKSAAKKRK